MERRNKYDALARLMATSSEAAIFKNFNELNLRNLLDMQAEILHLRIAIRGCCLALNQMSSSNTGQYSQQRYEEIKRDLDAKSQEMRGLLREYSEYRGKCSALEELVVC